MFRSFRMISMLCAMLFMSLVLTVGCGSADLCQDDTECRKGLEECRTDPAEGIKKCIKKKVVSACNPACFDNEECKDGKCVSKCEPACASDETCNNGKCEKNTPPGCTPACSTGSKCVNGTCVPSNDCNPACAGDEECQNGVCVKSNPACNPACGAGQECKNGICVQKAQCTSDAECPSGQECKESKCVPKSITGCNPPCQANEECKNNTCVPKPQCTTDAECPSGQECKANKCVPKPIGCNPACKPNEECKNNTCVPKTIGCNPPCGPNSTCQNGQCVPKSGCNPPCGPNEQCQNNKCVPKTTGCTPACKPNEQCVAGKCVPQSIGCNPACKATEECKNNKCVPKPNTCSQNSDCKAGQVCVLGKCQAGVPGCNPPCNAQTEICQNNKCVPKPCNPACKANETCQAGKCVAKPQCTKDGDCKAGEQCKANKCVPKPQCTKNSDCKATEECKANKCVPKPGCTPACKTGEECKAGKCVPKTCNPKCGANQSCVNGVCVAVGCNPACKASEQCINKKCVGGGGPAGVGDTCSQTKACKSGQSCLRTGSTNVCFQNCTADSNCASNPLRKSCVSISSTIKVCLQRAGQGQKCGFNGKLQSICDTGLFCKSGACQKTKEVDWGEKCGGSSGQDCKKGLTCYRIGTDAYCFQDCKSNTDCASNAARKTCSKQTATISICMKSGAKSGEKCGLAGKAQATCATGLRCTNGTCQGTTPTKPGQGEECNTTNKQCQTGFTCLRAGSSGKSYCFQNCTSNTTCASNPRRKTCFSVSSTIKICLQENVKENGKCGIEGKLQARCATGLTCQNGVCKKAKEVDWGEKCGAAGTTCKTGLTCYRVGTDAYCFQDCKTDSDCSANPGRKSCVAQGTSIKICMKTGAKSGEKCGLTGKAQANCATGLRCTNGTCQGSTPTQPGQGDECNTTNKRCRTGFTCLQAGGAGKSYCFQNCTSNTTCASNSTRKTCLTVSSTIKVCIQDNVKENGKCGLGGKLQARCGTGLFCDNGTCKKTTNVGVLEQCGANGKTCDTTKAVCLQLESGATHGYCLQKCTPGSSSSCPSNGECIALQGGGGACVPTGNLDNDALCGGQTGTKFDPSKACKKGLDCVNLGKRICTQIWSGNCRTAGKSCQSGRKCLTLSGSGSSTFGVCFSGCTTGNRCAKSHLTCRTTSSNTCWPR